MSYIRNQRYALDDDWITDGSSTLYPCETMAYSVGRVIQDEWYKF